MQAGTASTIINNDLGTLIQGAGLPDQRVEAIRDDLEANALYLADGSAQVLFVSCDLGALETGRVRRYKEGMAAAAGIPVESIVIGCSHTHSGPVVLHTNYQKPVDEDYSQRLHNWLCALAREAVDTSAPADIGWGVGNARLGYNRRVCYKDGSHSMYRQSEHPDEDFTGLEGPDDTQCLALAVFDEANRVRAVLHHGTGHPDTFYSQRVLSADFPGVARRLVREAHGEIPVLFFNGCQGDIAMSQQAHSQATATGKEAKMVQFGSALAGETLRLIHEMQPIDDVALRHLQRTLEVPVRMPTDEAVEKGRAVLARIDAGETITGMDAIFAWGPVSLVEQFGENPVDRLSLHVVRVGDLAIATQPCEMFCQYQLDTKRRSPTGSNAVFGVTDGFGGYVPTLAGSLGGGYSGAPFAWARFDPAVGCQIIDALAAMLHEMWRPAQ
ncbi:MAG: hypothetical protein K9N51_10305 [Candidatus Pacebacteria bacterium]|nr:hypothetical protein [Candidatus Paceibacterota bacterium]